MFKLLLLFPLMLVAGTLALAGVPLLLALLPVLLGVGAGVFAIVLVFAVLGLFLRLFAGLLIGVGGLVVLGLGLGLGFAVFGGLALFAMGAVLHLLLPLLLIVGLIWLVKRASHPAPPPALPAAHP